MSSKKRTRSQVSNIPVVEPNNKMAKLISSYTAKDIKNDRLESKRKVFYHKKKIEKLKNEIEKLELQIKKEEQKQKILTALNITNMCDIKLTKICKPKFEGEFYSSSRISSPNPFTSLVHLV